MASLKTMNYGNNGKMNISKLLLCISTCSAIFANAYADNCITVPELQNHKIKIDGKISPNEWDKASLIAPMLSMNNKAVLMPSGEVNIAFDKDYLFLGIKTKFQPSTDVAGAQSLKTLSKQRDSRVFDDDSVEIILSTTLNSPKLHQIILNSAGTIYDAEYTDNSSNPNWNIKQLKSASTVKDCTWILEVKIPRKEVGLDNVKSCYLNICRNWARLRSNSTLNGGEYLDRKTMFRLDISKKGENVKIHQPVQKSENMSFKAKASGKLKLRFTSTTGKKILQTINTSTGGVASFNMQHGGFIDYLLENMEGKILFSRQFNFPALEHDPLPPADKEITLGSYGKAQLRFYPGLNRMAINAKFNNVKNYTLNVTCKNVKKSYKVNNDILKAAFPLEKKPGTYSITFRLLDKKQKTVSQTTINWKRVSWEWENKKLGITNKPIPPFNHLKIKGNTISALTQSYTSGNLGLWKSVLINNKELLHSPITLNAIQNGKKINFNANISGYTPAGSVDKQTLTTSIAGDITLKTIAKYECDGMMYMTLELSAKKNVSLDKLSLQIPLKNKDTYSMHAVGDLIRSNPTGKIPEGTGLIWNSNSVPRRQIDGKPLLRNGFTPYIWLGGFETGICFFADNDRGYSLNQSDPMIKLYRNKDVLTVDVSLINKKVQIGPKKRIISFGLQGTPVKPKAPHTLKLSAQNKSRIKGADMLIMWVLPGSFGSDSLFAFDQGMKNKWEVFDWFASCVKSNKVDPIKKKEMRKKVENHLMNVYAKQRSDIKRVASQYIKKESPERYQTNYILNNFDAITNYAKNTDKFFVYFDPRLIYINSAEYEHFRSEWWAPHKVGYIKAARTYPTASLIDRLLYSGYQRLQHGADGIYYDDTFILPTINRESDIDGKIDEPGVTRTGILAMRELLKRTAAMSYELKKDPLIMVHHTDAMLIPCFSFANLGLTWEMAFIDEDTQDRYTEDYIFAESNGFHCGLTSFVITGIKHYSHVKKDFKTRWPIVLRQRTLSLLAVTLQHQMKTYGNWDIDQDAATAASKAIYGFMANNNKCEFIPYWNKDKRIQTSPGYKAGTYLGNKQALIIVSNFKTKNKGKININLEKLGISQDSEIFDLVKRTTISNNTTNLDIPYNAFTILYVGAKGTGKNILTSKDSADLRLKGTLVLAQNSTIPLPTEWKARPNFVSKNNVAKKYKVIKKANGSWSFTVDNTKSQEPATMIWTADYDEFQVTPNENIIITYNHKNVIDSAQDVFTFSRTAKGKKAYLFFPKMNYRSVGKNSIIQNTPKETSTLKRLYVRVTAQPGMKGEITLNSLVKRNRGK